MNIDSSLKILREAIDQFNPTHIVSMVSGGKDSAASDALARLLRELDRAVDGRTSDKSSADRWAHNLARAKVLEILKGDKK